MSDLIKNKEDLATHPDKLWYCGLDQKYILLLLDSFDKSILPTEDVVHTFHLIAYGQIYDRIGADYTLEFPNEISIQPASTYPKLYSRHTLFIPTRTDLPTIKLIYYLGDARY